MSSTHWERRAAVKILLSDADNEVRRGLASTLKEQGYRAITLSRDVKDAASKLEDTLFDLVIVSGARDYAAVAALIEDMRHNRVGQNPFTIVMVSVVKPDPSQVARIVQSGIDDLLLLPVPANRLLDRIDQLTYRRKPFIVTSDYLGPERRGPAARNSRIPLIDVPNTLRQRAEGEKIDEAVLAVKIQELMTEINLQRRERFAQRVSFLTELLIKSYGGIRVSERIMGSMDDLSNALSVLEARLTDDKTEHVRRLCGSMRRSVEHMRGEHMLPDRKQLALLKPMALAIQLELSRNQTREQIAGEVAVLVDSFLERRRGAGTHTESAT